MNKVTFILCICLLAAQCIDAGAQESVETSAAKESNQLVVVEFAQLLLKDNVKLASREAGVIVEVDIKEGALVEDGQVLLRLDEEIYQAERAVAMGST